VKVVGAASSVAGRAFPFSQWAASMLGFAFGSPPAYERPERTLHGRLAVNEREPQRSSVAQRAGVRLRLTTSLQSPERRIQDRRLAVNEREPQRSSVARRAGRSPFGLMLTRGYFR
jgi:hypothetical protein